jgi:hypothetical protein
MKRIRSFFLFSLFFSFFSLVFSSIPIQFGIPSKKILTEIPAKTKDFAHIIPGDLKTYIYTQEEDYYRDYQDSYFAITCKKGGWDCLRHYEILANGCIPFFLDINDCPKNTMSFFPKDLVAEAMNLPGVSYLKIDHNIFNKEAYKKILEKLLEFTKNNLSTEALGRYILEKIGYCEHEKILFLTSGTGPDYQCDLSLIGLKQILRSKVVDYPKIDYIYDSYSGEIQALYGRGMTYTKIIGEDEIMRDEKLILNQIKRGEYKHVIYGSIHRGLPFIKIVKDYSKRLNLKIHFICGEDIHSCEYKSLKNLFSREHK